MRNRHKSLTAITLMDLIPLPAEGHPIWALSRRDVATAHALCCLFAAIAKSTISQGESQ